MFLLLPPEVCAITAPELLFNMKLLRMLQNFFLLKILKAAS